MGERKGTNKYYPPDFDPGKGSLNAYHGTHALRERARKIHEGIIIIRFEMPYNIWCNGCGNHIGMGVRYNAQKRKVGNYYTTPIYKFRMKCHLCDQHFEIQTDPKNCDYVILSGAKRKEERWDPAVTENIQTTDRDVKAKLISDAMFKLEHSIEDKHKAKRAAPTINQIRNIRDEWEDDYAISQILRKKFREEKKEINKQKGLDDEFKERNLLPSSMELAKDTEEDAELSKRMRFGEDLRPDLKRKKRQQDVKHSSIFEKQTSSKTKLALHLAGLAKRKRNSISTNKVEKIPTNVKINKIANFETDGTAIVKSIHNEISGTELSESYSRLRDANGSQSNEMTNNRVKSQSKVKGQPSDACQSNVPGQVDIVRQLLPVNHKTGQGQGLASEAKSSESGSNFKDETNVKGQIIHKEQITEQEHVKGADINMLNLDCNRSVDMTKPLVAEYGSSSDETD